jgi:hypothetical protein
MARFVVLLAQEKTMPKFCPTNARHMLESVEYATQTYACIECEQLYQDQSDQLVRVEYRLTHGKDPFFMAQEAKEFRTENRRMANMMRNDRQLQLLITRNRR